MKMNRCNKLGKMLLLSLGDGHMQVLYTGLSTLGMSENFCTKSLGKKHHRRKENKSG